MKRIVALILIVISSSLLWSAPSQSDFIPLDSVFYEEFDTLLVSIGRKVNMTRPYTYGEARIHLDSMSSYEMSMPEKRVYDKLVSMVKGEESDNVFTFDYSMKLQPEIYIHGNTSFSDRVDFMNLENATAAGIEYGYQNQDKYLTWDKDKPHFLDLDLSLSVKDRVTLLFRFPVTNTVHTGTPSGSKVFMTNIPFLASFTDFSAKNFQDFSMNFPYRAYLSAADSWYSVLIGRERFNYGAGKTGNFIVDGSLPYHNALSLSFFSSTFKYTFMLSFFPHPSQYIERNEDDKTIIINGTEYASDLIFDQNGNAFTGIKMFMSHRFDWTMDNGRHRMAVTEAIVYQNDSSVLDLQILNPMMFFHNLYIAGNANSFLQVEWDMAIIKGLSQHVAIAVDDFNIPFESTDGSDPRPNAIGIQYGLDTSHPIGRGFLESSIELTYMSPYFYLRDGKSDSSFPLDFVVAIRNQRSAYGIYDLYTLGYPGGGDQTVVHLSLSYREPFHYKAGFIAEYRLYGTKNLMTVYAKGDDSKPFTHSIRLQAAGDYYIMDNLKVSSSLTGLIFLNYNNEEGRTENDIQFRISMCYTL